ncbi:MAG: hypothetical protein CMF70_01505 [Magnetovibrio sp.]|nr:hypothetical protein [Magnetovibrio sp.]
MDVALRGWVTRPGERDRRSAGAPHHREAGPAACVLVRRVEAVPANMCGRHAATSERDSVVAASAVSLRSRPGRPEGTDIAQTMRRMMQSLRSDSGVHCLCQPDRNGQTGCCSAAATMGSKVS